LKLLVICNVNPLRWLSAVLMHWLMAATDDSVDRTVKSRRSSAWGAVTATIRAELDKPPQLGSFGGSLSNASAGAGGSSPSKSTVPAGLAALQQQNDAATSKRFPSVSQAASSRPTGLRQS
jgi:hypothetical protein